MYDNKYYHKSLTGTEEEIDRKAFEIWDRIAIEFLKDGITNTHQKEIIDAVNEYDYLKEYIRRKLKKANLETQMLGLRKEIK